jgi:hypothetical protein
MNRRNLFRAILALLVVATFAATASAQKKKDEDAGTRGVQGTVFGPDEQLVVGAVVQLKDMRTLQVRSFITQKDGTYHFTGLKLNSDYQLKADFQGLSSSTKTLSLFDDRKDPLINLKLEKK